MINQKVIVFLNKNVFSGVVKYIFPKKNRVFVEDDKNVGFLQEAQIDDVYLIDKPGIEKLVERLKREKESLANLINNLLERENQCR